MNDDRRIMGPPDDDREPLVTYSRVGSRSGRSVKRGPRPARTEPHLTAAEVPWTPGPEPVVAPDLRAVPFDLPEGAAAGFGVDPLAPPRRPRTIRYLVVGGALAVAAGIGILVVSFGTAGLAPGTAPATSSVSTSPPLPAGTAEAVAAPDGGGPGVREISLTGEDAPSDGGDGAATSADVGPAAEPPVPRERPERVAVGAPDAETAAPAAVAPAAAVAPPAAQPEAVDEADFIARIEQTLATLPAAPTASAVAPAPAVAPAALAPVAPAAVEPLFPDDSAALPDAADDGAPLDWSSALDTVPPPAGMRDSATFAPTPAPSAPVPPADIPNVPAASGLQ